MSNTITSSSVLIDNFETAELISADHKFEALQTREGLALLFSIASDNHFYITSQESGEATFWCKQKLSASISNHLGGKSFQAKTFSVSEDNDSNTINLGLTVTSDGEDHLFFSYGHDTSHGSISSAIEWTPAPFNAQSSVGKVNIKNTYLHKLDNKVVLVADLLDSDNHVRRFLISNSDDKIQWKESGNQSQINGILSSCIGQIAQKKGSGMYNLSRNGSSLQLSFLELQNKFILHHTIFDCPGTANCIASMDNSAGQKSTDLFVSTSQGLFYFPSNKQVPHGEGILVVEDTIFNETTKLFATNDSGKCVVWGINSSNEIYHCSCPVDQLSDLSEWTVPIKIMTQVDQVSPYINRANTANVFFAATNNVLKIAQQHPKTTIWNVDGVALTPPAASEKAVKTYFTTIKYRGPQGQILFNPTAEGGVASMKTIEVWSDSRIPVRINNLYYILDDNPKQIPTDRLGNITIIQEVNSLVGAKLYFSEGTGQNYEANPMQYVYNKMHLLNDADKLANAMIHPVGQAARNVVPGGSTNPHLTKAAAAIVQLQKVKTDQEYFEMVSNFEGSSLLKGIKSDLGDLVNYAKTGLSVIGDFSVQLVDGLYHFVIDLGDQFYHAVIKGMEDVLAAMDAVFHALESDINDLLDFLKHLFEWDDVWETHKVLSSMMNNGVAFIEETVVEQFDKFSNQFTQSFSKAKSELSTISLPTQYASTTLDGIIVKQDQDKVKFLQHNPSMDWLIYHITHSIGDAFHLAEGSDENPLSDLIKNDFKDFVKGAFAKQLNQQLGGKEHLLDTVLGKDFSLANIFELIKELGVAGLSFIEKIMEKLLQLLSKAFDFLQSKMNGNIEIPFISKFYEFLVKHLGGKEMTTISGISFLLAIPVTAIYKEVHGSAPFKNGAQGLDSSDLFHNIFDIFGSEQTMLASDIGGIKEAYLQICHPIGEAIGLLNMGIEALASFAELNTFFEIFTGSLGLLSTLLTADLPEDGINIGFYIPRWICDLGADAIVGFVVGFMPQPFAAIGDFVLQVINIIFHLPLDIAVIVQGGADQFKSWVPLILDAADIFGTMVADIGFMATGTGELSVFVGGELAWLIPIGLVVGGIGLTIAGSGEIVGMVLDIEENH